MRDSGDWTPLVSVIVPVFDDAERLASCLSALQAQTYPTDRYEVVVVDNGSREDLGAVVAGFQGFGFVREDRVGSYAARNKGIEASKGEVLAFTDADCLPDPGWIEAGVRALAGRPEWRAVGGPIEMFAQDADRLTPFDLHDLVWGLPRRGDTAKKVSRVIGWRYFTLPQSFQLLISRADGQTRELLQKIDDIAHRHLR